MPAEGAAKRGIWGQFRRDHGTGTQEREAILNPIVPRLRRSPWMAAFLDAVNVSAVGLMAAVLVRLTGDIVTTWPAVVIALLAAAAVLRWRVTSAWVVIGGALLGWPLSLLG